MRNSEDMQSMLPGKVKVPALLVLLATALAGCSSASYPPLPDLGGIGQTLLTPDQQQAKIKELAAAQANAGATVQPALAKDPAPAQ
jgi:hypothetical protein